MMKPVMSIAEARRLVSELGSDIRLIEVVSGYYDGHSGESSVQPLSFPFNQIATEQLEIDRLWTLRPAEELEHELAQAGLSSGTDEHVLIFDHIRVGCGSATSRFEASARLYSVLISLGFSRVSIIHDAAVGPDLIRQLAVPSGPSVPLPSEVELIPDRAHLLNYQSMLDLLNGELGEYRLLDARSQAEFDGTDTGYDYVALAGRIPTAEHVDSGDYIASHSESIETLLDRLAETLAEKEIRQHDLVVWYCGTAWRASRMYALTRALGFTNVAIYDGGWFEWQLKHPEQGAAPSFAEPVRLSCD